MTRSLMQARRAVALALASGEWDGSVGDAIPQDVWQSLYDERLLIQTGDISGESCPFLTPAGEKALLGMVNGTISHGRHCTCSACAREDWTRITSPCGMHGPDCPAVYAPLGAAGDPRV